MTPRRRAAFALRGALTFSCAVLVHGAVHAVGDRSFVWDSPAHGVMLALALALLAVVAVPLGLVGPRAERRRRLALVRAALGPASAGGLAAGIAGQAAIAAALLGAEGASLAPERLLPALLSGLLALLCTTLLLAAGGERVVALLVALATVSARSAAPVAARRRLAPRLRAAEPYRLFVPNRPPPLAA
jgi:hypothetical protein